MRRFAIALAAILAATQAAAEVRYEVVDLSNLSDEFQPFGGAAYFINNAGQIAGPPGVWTPGVGVKPMAFPTIMAINDVGQVVGFDSTIAYLWTPGPTFADPGTLQNLGPGVATGLNNLGEVVGAALAPDGPRPWLWTQGTGRVDLLFPLEHERGGADDINDSGLIVGMDRSSPTIFFWQPGSIVGEMVITPGLVEYANDLNNLGQFAGEMNTEAQLYTPGVGYQGLGSLNGKNGSGTALNDSAQVVGISTNDLDDDLGTAWTWSQAEGIVDLNTLIAPQGPDGWFLREPTSINNAGQIVGLGRLGEYESIPFLLNPVPEPATIVLGILAVPAFVLVARRKTN